MMYSVEFENEFTLFFNGWIFEIGAGGKKLLLNVVYRGVVHY